MNEKTLMEKWRGTYQKTVTNDVKLELLMTGVLNEIDEDLASIDLEEVKREVGEELNKIGYWKVDEAIDLALKKLMERIR